MVMHLRMTGNMLVVGPKEERPHTRVVFHLTGKDRVLFTDPRRFGTGVVLLGDDALDDYFDARIGVEPLGTDFTTDALKAMAQGRKQPVKAFLLNQERVAGVGNIYADEALFKAKIHPLKPVGTLKRHAARRATPGRHRGAAARASTRRARRSTTSATPTAPTAASRPASRSTCARASRASAAARRSRRCARPGVAPTSASGASPSRA